VPEARDLPLGLQESALTIEGPPPVGADTHRRVSLSYAIETSNVVYLDIQRGDRIPPGGASELNGSVSGSAANIRERTYPGRGGSAPFSLVFYTWARGGLLHTLTVRLDRGLTRELADHDRRIGTLTAGGPGTPDVRPTPIGAATIRDRGRPPDRDRPGARWRSSVPRSRGR